MVSIWVAVVELLDEVLYVNQVFFRLPSKLVRWVALPVDVVLVSSTAMIWPTANYCCDCPLYFGVVFCTKYWWR